MANCKVINIEGICCECCASKIQKGIEEVEGVERAVVSMEDDKAEVYLKDGAEIADEALKEVVESLGDYQVKGIQ